MKRYVYDNKIFNVRVTAAGIIGLVVGLFSIYRLLTPGTNTILYLLILLVCVYTFWETFVSLSNPKEVQISDEGITFKAYNKEHHYAWSDIKDFHLKEFIHARKLYLTINKPTLFRGKYWVNCYYMNDTDEIFIYLLKKECEIHPNSLKAQSRKFD